MRCFLRRRRIRCRRRQDQRSIGIDQRAGGGHDCHEQAFRQMSLDSQKSLPRTKEEAEPIADRTTVPILLIGLFAVLLFLGLVYLNEHGGGFNAEVYEPYASFDELKAGQPKTQGGEAIVRGKLVYQTCAQCHQPNGLGSTTVGAPPLAGSDWVQAEGPNRIIRIVLNGLTGPVQVIGNPYGTGTMTPFKDVFTDQQVADVLTYVRQEWGNKGGPVKPEEVTAIRKETADKMGNWTAPDLQQVPVK